MSRSILSKSFVLGLLLTMALVLMACTSQVPGSATVGSAQVNSDSARVDEAAGSQLASSETSAAVEATAGSQDAQVDPEVTDLQTSEVDVAAGVGSSATLLREGSDSNDGTTIQQVSGRNIGSEGIYVSGSGTAKAAPDLATLRLGVEVTDVTVSRARTRAAEDMTDVIAAVRQGGVEEKDIQSGHYRIHPRYTGREITRCVESDAADSGVGLPGVEGGKDSPAISTVEPEGQECFQEYQSVVTGYEVVNSVVVLVRDLDNVDDVIDRAVEAGGDSFRFENLSFSIQDSSPLRSEARAAAMAEMKAKAEEMASLAGVSLGDVVFLSETFGAAPPAPLFGAERAFASIAADTAPLVSTPIAPGEVSVEVQVVGQYLIADSD